jgi:hypothetical protein
VAQVRRRGSLEASTATGEAAQNAWRKLVKPGDPDNEIDTVTPVINGQRTHPSRERSPLVFMSLVFDEADRRNLRPLVLHATRADHELA